MDEGRTRGFKTKVFQAFAKVAKALANARRLELLDLLTQCERTVEELAWETGMSVANTSQHLQAMRNAGLVEVRREGVYGYYRLADEGVYRAVQAIRDLAEGRVPELERAVASYRSDRDADTVSADELVELLRSSNVIVLDVRPGDEYRAGHIAGARSLPLPRLEPSLHEVPGGSEIVAYSRGRYCVFADEAVTILRAHGYAARRLRDGLPDWRAAGLPVATGGEG